MTYYPSIIFQISFLTNFVCILTPHAAEPTTETLLTIQHRTYTTALPLVCPPCEQINCHHQYSNLQCGGGYTTVMCGCCPACAKLENEQCGGYHDFLGTCDDGLECEPQPPKQFSYMIHGVEEVYTYIAGICKVAKKRFQVRCKPICSPEFCNENPRAICSARENAEFSQYCQGKCQHTSCRACRFITKEKPCKECAANDEKCIRRFGRCFQRKICKTKQYPCESLKAEKKNKPEFVCAVPSCHN